MIRIEQYLPTGKAEATKKDWMIYSEDSAGIKTAIQSLSLANSSLTNKFDIVQSLVNEMNDLFPDDFGVWYENMIINYVQSNYNSEIILEEASNFIEYSKKYVEAKNINYSQFVDHDKKSATSILFVETDMVAIAISSTALKLYSIFNFDANMKLTENVHRLVFQTLVTPCYEIGTTTKVYQTMRSRTYRSSITDKSMWEIIKVMVLDTPDTYVMEVFNFMMQNLLSTLDVDTNPVPFITNVIDKSIKWLMKSVYNDKIIYGEVFGTSLDIQGASQKDEFYIKCCNDVIEKAANAGMRILSERYQLDEESFTEVRERLDNVLDIFPVQKRLTIPIASKVLEIPYNYFLSAPPKHIMLIGVFMNECAKGIIDERFQVLTEFMLGCPKDPRVLPVRSSYKIKNLEFVINDKNLLFGFKSPNLKFDVMSCICGILSASKKNLVSVIDGNPLPKVTYVDMENEVIMFFNELYNKKLDFCFDQMRERADSYL